MKRPRADIDRFISLRVQGFSFDKIHEMTGITKQTGRRWVKKYAGLLKEAEEVLEREMIEKFKVIQRKNFEFLESQVSKLNEAITKLSLESESLRDLTNSRKELMAELAKSSNKDEITAIQINVSYANADKQNVINDSYNIPESYRKISFADDEEY